MEVSTPANGWDAKWKSNGGFHSSQWLGCQMEVQWRFPLQPMAGVPNGIPMEVSSPANGWDATWKSNGGVRPSQWLGCQGCAREIRRRMRLLESLVAFFENY